jgi:hypothetical protein
LIATAYPSAIRSSPGSERHFKSKHVTLATARGRAAARRTSQTAEVSLRADHASAVDGGGPWQTL